VETFEADLEMEGIAEPNDGAEPSFGVVTDKKSARACAPH
jgi:hypothetical protein